MLPTYFHSAIRHLRRDRLHSVIPIAGLSIGMTVVLLIGLWTADELGYNKQFAHYDRIAQVMHHDTFNGERMTLPWNPYLMGDVLKAAHGSDFNQIVMSTAPGSHVLSYTHTNITSSGSFMSEGAPSMLSLDMPEGKRDALKDPHSILLARSTAKALFGDRDPEGQALLLDDRLTVKVAGVYADLPASSDFAGQAFIAPWSLFVDTSGIKVTPHPWNNNNFLTYVELASHADMATVSARIRDIKKNNVPAAMAATLQPVVFLHPMSRWHLYSEFKDGINTGGRIEIVRLFIIIGLFVLLQACINFVNLATARARHRAKEIGIRKTVGGLRRQLIGQLVLESVLTSFLAFSLALLLAQSVLPAFNALSGKGLSIPWGDPLFGAMGLVAAVLVGIVAGSYPAFYLSSFHPVTVLKGAFRTGPLATVRREVLVVLQFTISAVLVIGTLVVFRQIGYAKDRAIGYNANHLITLAMTPDIRQHYASFRDDLKRSGAALEVAASANSTVQTDISSGRFDWAGKDPRTSLDIPISNVTSEYGKVIGWTISAGRDFSDRMPTDSSAFVVNEAAVRYMGLKDPVGETIQWKDKPFHIIGVIRDIVFESPYQAVRPYIYQMTGDPSRYVSIKLNPASGVPAALEKTGRIYQQYSPNLPFDYQFTDQACAQKFGDEVRIGRLAVLFTILAVVISCLGIFGLSTFITEQRKKEIAIRKVLGGSSLGLFVLLSGGFNRLVLLSLVIGSPVAYYFAHRWLQHYAYHSGVPWWIFAVTAIGLLGITLLTVSYHSIRAARTNPIGPLRNE